MPRLATIPICLVVGALFAWKVPLERLFEVFQTVISALAIMAAAILVRLNRTMPSLDWKILEDEARENLTTAIVRLAREYLGFLALVAIVILGILALMIIGREEIFGAVSGEPVPMKAWFEWIRRADSGLLGASTTLVCVRMGYLVWRDFDIVRLQKQVVDRAAAQAHQAEQERLAAEKRANIARAGLRSIQPTAPKTWDE